MRTSYSSGNLFYMGKSLPIKSNDYISIFYTYLWAICRVLKIHLPQIPHDQILPKTNQQNHFNMAIQEQDI